MEDIVFVTGRDCVRSYMNVAFLGGERARDAQVSFGAKVVHGVFDGPDVQWKVLPENIRGAVLKQGPEGKVC
jgi:hypothetical protein